MWILQLNMMRNRTESVTQVAWAETKEELEAYLEREKAPERWDDHDGLPDGFTGGATVWRKTFMKGSELEYFNPPHNDMAAYGIPAFVNVGTEEDWINRAKADYNSLKQGIKKV